MNTDSNDFDQIELEENTPIINYVDLESFRMNIMPNNLTIATMTISCHLGTLFKINNIYKYMLLDNDNIVAIKSKTGMRCIDSYKAKFKSTNQNSSKNFYNQLTTVIRVSDEKFINIKLFKNGSIQMTGCKKLEDTNIVINKLINKLKERLIAINDENENQTDITFVENPNLIEVTRFKIDLINCGFGVNYLINREQLHNLLSEFRITSRISSIHACVNIKYKIVEDSVEHVLSIFVFQTGSIIIIGKKADFIKEAYGFIVSFLNKNKHKIIKRDISKMLSADEIKEILQRHEALQV